MMNKISILVVDDHTMVRNIWATVLTMQERYQVVAECASGEDAIVKATALRPQIILLDINLPGISGIETAKHLRKFSPASKIICISLHTQLSYVRQMMLEGAMGYVTKSSSKDEMFKAIDEVHSGKKYVCEEIKNILSDGLGSTDDKAGLKSLSAREMEIICEIKKGLSSKEIARMLFLSSKTVEVHRCNILRKLQLKNTASLINFVNGSPELS